LAADLRERLRALVCRVREEREMDEELQTHLQFETERQMATGLDPVEARRRAHLRLGGMERVKEEVRSARGTRVLEDVGQDIRYGLRTLRRRPGFTAAVALSLGLGIGANTAIFSLMDAVLWRTLPVDDPQGLWAVGDRFPYDGFRVLEADDTVLAGAAAAMRVPLNVSIDGSLEPTAEGLLVSSRFFSLLGVTPAAGRAIGLEDHEVPGGHPVVMLGDGYWTRRFGRDRSVVGRAIAISGSPYTVVGIAPPNFAGIEVGTAPDLYVPVTMQSAVMPALGNRPNAITGQFRVLARLLPGVTPEQAASALEGPVIRWVTAELGTRLSPELGDRATPARIRLAALNLWPGLTPAAAGFSDLRDQVSRPLFLLLFVVGTLLLIACANTANLLLARATVRRREFATRLALGAGRARLMRQLLVESVMLAVLGGTVGLAVAYWATDLLVAFMSIGQTPIMLDLRPDLRVLSFTALVSLATGLLFGIVPAVRATGFSFTSTLRGAVGLGGGGRGWGPDRMLAVVQLALSLVLLIGAGVSARSLAALNDRDFAFDRDRVIVVRVEPHASNSRSRARQGAAGLDRLYRDLLDRVSTLPGVVSASLAQFTPTNRMGIERQATTPSGEVVNLHIPMVYPRYFETVGMPLVAGRDLAARDLDAESSPVAVVNETFARQFYLGESPIGQPCLVNISPSTRPCAIVGLVRDSAYADFTGDIVATLYQPFLQTAGNRGQMALHVRVVGEPVALIPAIRAEVAETDPTVPHFEARTLAEEVSGVMIRERLLATLASVFGAVALALACVGLYGLLAFAVVGRTAEIGVRMALGASRRDVVLMVLREALVLLAAGGTVGVLIGVAAARLASRQVEGFFGLDAIDPVSIAGALVVLVLVATLAAVSPARGAAAIDPTQALRDG
jgi:predicted permease